MKRAIARQMKARAKSYRHRLHGNLALQLLDAALEEIAAELQRTGRAHVPGFGVFRVATTKARNVRNPQTNELMQLPAMKGVRFRPAKALVKKVRSE